MAGRLLMVGMTALLVHGCLIPQDDPVLADLPPKKNTSPILLTPGAAPAQHDYILHLRSDCPNKDRPFSIGVVDPDLEDIIESRWYVDPSPLFDDTIPVSSESFPKGTVKEERGSLRPLNLLYQAGSKLFTATTHSVTVVVTDRRFPPTGIVLDLANLDLPDGGTVKDSSLPVQYTWEVTTDLSTCP
jgi:hypothetical protein